MATLIHRAKAHFGNTPPDKYIVLDQAHPAAKGLVGAWLHGTRDYSVNRINASYAGGASATVVDGYKCTSFVNGDYISCSTDTRYNVGTGDFEFSCWAWPDFGSASTSAYGLVIKRVDANNRFYMRFRNLQWFHFHTIVGGTTRFVQDATMPVSLVRGRWNHVRAAVNRADAAVRLWIDNNLATSLSMSISGVNLDNAGALGFGSALDYGAPSWIGYLRDIRFRKTLLDEKQRAEEFARGYRIFRKPRLYLIPTGDDESLTETQAPPSGALLLSGLVPTHLIALNNAPGVSTSLLLGAAPVGQRIGLNNAAAVPGPLLLSGKLPAHPVHLDSGVVSAQALLLSGRVAIHLVGLNNAAATAGPLLLFGDNPSHKVSDPSIVVPGSLLLVGSVPEHWKGANSVMAVSSHLLLLGNVAFHPVTQVLVPGLGVMTFTGYSPGHKTIPYFTQWASRADKAALWTRRVDREAE